MTKEKFFKFFQGDLWNLTTADLPLPRRVALSSLKLLLLTFRGFHRDQCTLRATALTLYTLLSVVPVLALAFGIAKGFGFERHLKEQILLQLPEQEAVLKEIILFAQNLLETAKGGVIAGVGVVVLLWSVVNIFGQIENALNQVWNIKKGRSLGRKFSDYLSLMLICPVAMILSGSITVYLSAQAAVLSEKTALLGFVSFLLLSLLKLLPYFILWVFFAFIYLFMPNRKIPYRSGLAAGMVAGTLYQVVQWAYITLQVGVAKYNAIYGSFAALPLFLVWLQISWIIVLFGAELSFSLHRRGRNDADLQSAELSLESLKIAALQVTHAVIRDFRKGRPSNGSELFTRLQYPPALLKKTLDRLCDAGILSEMRTEDDDVDSAYQPGRDTDDLTIGFILKRLDQQGGRELPLPETPETRRFREALAAFSEAVRRSPENRKLKEI